MRTDFVELRAGDPAPAIGRDRGVDMIPDAERRLHSPDRTVLLVEEGSLVARCSCWWRATPALDEGPIGAIGHYAAAGAPHAATLLARACHVLAGGGCRLAVGPMDGNTWRRYRFVVDRGTEPPFLLEPDNPDDWPAQWQAAGFSPLAHYSSAVNDDLHHDDPRTAAVMARLTSAGIRIRPFDAPRADTELHAMFDLALAAFRGNFLYSPLAEAEFLAQNRALLPLVRPELVLLAERDGDSAGFVFALPDALQAARGAVIDTIIVKTLAVHPAMRGMGLGGALTDLVQRSARQLGYRRAIHALMHEENASRRISGRYARTIRRYALFARRLASP